MDGRDALVGTWILDQYRIVRVLAQGGMGRVYLAEQTSMDRHAAIKILSARAEPKADWRSRFRQEARAASRLTHPNIVTVYNFGELADGSLFLAMEYVPGPSLAALLAQGQLPVQTAIRIAGQCTSALAHAHTKHVIHRDLKPENMVVMDPEGDAQVKLVDFGIARLREETDLTQPGDLIGTPRYLSPEQCRGEIATESSDQYALGLVIHEMLTGKPAIVASSTIGYLHLHQRIVPALPSAGRPDETVKLLDPIVMRMVEKSPKKRYLDMKAVEAELGRIARVTTKEHTASPGRSRTKGSATVQQRPIAQPNSADIRARRVTAPGKPLNAALLGDTPILLEGEFPVLRDRQLEICGTFETVEELDASGIEPDYAAIGVAGTAWHALSEQRASWPVPPDRTLICVDSAPRNKRLHQITDHFQHLLIGTQPLDPLPLGIAWGWMRDKKPGGIEHLLSDHAVQVLQVTSSRAKSTYVDSLLEDLRNQGVRRAVLQAAAEVSEEMILNAVFHSPVDGHGERRYAQSPRSTDITLEPGEEATFRWLLHDRYIALAIQDAFGSLAGSEIVARITGQTVAPQLDDDSTGAGMGLRIMSQAAQHLFFAICPGGWCEVLALIDREPTSRSAARRTVCILQGVGHQTARLGDRLRLITRETNSGTLLELQGEVNETSDLGPVFAHRETVRLDLSGITRINSVGLRNWLEAARSRSTGLQLSYERCSLAMIRQMNLIPTFLEQGTVTSFLAPYFCPSCKLETLELIEPSAVRDLTAPAQTCPQCAQDLTLDALADEYFAFLETDEA